MGLKDIIKQKSEEHVEALKKSEEMEREARRKAEEMEREIRRLTEMDAVSVPPHPLRERESAFQNDYVLGLLILRDEMPPQDTDDNQLFFFAKSLFAKSGDWRPRQERLNEIKKVSSIYDEQAKLEHLEKLVNLLHQDDEVNCFLCDIALLHGKKYSFDGEMLEFWKEVCFGIFKLNNERVASLEKLCRAMLSNGQLANADIFKSISKDVFDYCLAWADPVISILSGELDTYLVIDLSRGSSADNYPVRTTHNIPKLADICAKDELWLRRIPAGSFVMGSPLNELGRQDYEQQHTVTLTQDFYIGVFPVTWRQWCDVLERPKCGLINTPPYDSPLICVSYDNICGPDRNWMLNPYVYCNAFLGTDRDKLLNSYASYNSFLGILRRKTRLDGFDLPTEAQWEYVSRFGTTTALNNGKDLTSLDKQNPNLDEIIHYNKNKKVKGRTLRQPNAMGVYYFENNFAEWCRDWYGGGYPPGNVTDPGGPSSGQRRVYRLDYASRSCEKTDCSSTILGFRLVFMPRL